LHSALVGRINGITSSRLVSGVLVLTSLLEFPPMTLTDSWRWAATSGIAVKESDSSLLSD
jgi:hypothetical protein